MAEQSNINIEELSSLLGRKPRIGLFIDTFFPMIDGVVMVVDNYARRMCQVADVTVFTTKGRKPFDDSTLPYKVVRCPIFKLPFIDYDMPLPSMSHKFKKAVFSSDLDIVHIHSPFGVGKMGAKYAKKHNIPLIATMHSQYYRDFLKSTHNNKLISKMLLKSIMKVFNKCDECWAVNGAVGRMYHEEYGAKSLPLTRLNGTDLHLYTNLDDVAKYKMELGIEDDEKVFFFMGRITVLKNIDFIIRSLKILYDNGFKFKMLFAGTGPDSEDMQALCKDLGIEDRVLFLGRIVEREKTAMLYRMADLFLFPSLYDCNSLVQIEASSQMTPTLFLEGATTADTVTPDFNGYVSDNNEQSYADKMMKIFSNEEEYKKVCQNAFDTLYLTWDDCVNIATSDYMRVLKGKQNDTKD